MLDKNSDRYSEDMDDSDYGGFGNRSSHHISLNTSFLEVKPDSITFSVHEVDQLKPENSDLIPATQIFEKVNEALKEEIRVQTESKTGEERSYGDPIPVDLGKLQDLSIRHENSKALFEPERESSVVGSIYKSFVNHRHLSLSPSDFILMIGHGMSAHVNMNAEKLRHCFVDHEGKQDIIIMNSSVSLDGNSSWYPVCEQFAKEVKRRVKKDMYEVMIDNTSTATLTTKVVSELNLLDCMKNYFRYICWAGCGFPYITLRGKPEDWRNLQEKVHRLEKMNKGNCLEIDWWLESLVPVVDKICETGITRTVDYHFWGNICCDYEEYGTFVNGWINVFLPYVFDESKGYRKNGAIVSGFGEESFMFNEGIMPSEMNEGITKVPFIYVDGVKEHDMHFYSGFMGNKVNEDGSVQMEYFWAVYQDSKQVKSLNEKKAKNKTKSELLMNFKFDPRTSPYAQKLGNGKKLASYYTPKPFKSKV